MPRKHSMGTQNTELKLEMCCVVLIHANGIIIQGFNKTPLYLLNISSRSRVLATEICGWL
jgi:hypothetical protein